MHAPWSRFRRGHRVVCGLTALIVTMWLGSMSFESFAVARSTQQDQPDAAAGQAAPAAAASEAAAGTDAPQTTPGPAAKSHRKKKAERRLDQQPYRVLVLVEFQRDVALPTQYQSKVLGGIRAIIDRTWGAMWRVEIRGDEQLSPATPDVLDRLNEKTLHERFGDDGPDKVMFAVVGKTGVTYRTAVREWDTQSRSLSHVQQAETVRRDQVAETTVGLMRQLFSADTHAGTCD